MTRAALLACPFCGGIDLATYGRLAVACRDCGADGPIAIGVTSDRAESEAARLWNARTKTIDLMAALRKDIRAHAAGEGAE